MDKRKKANLRVKESITNTLFSMMEKKSLGEITVTELVNGAGVARVSFYRNYSSKEDVLVTLIRDILEAFRCEIDMERDDFYTYENMLLSFRYFKQYQKYVLDLYHSGFASVLLEELNRFHEGIEGTMPSSSIEKYQLYAYIGALFNTAMVWLLEDDPASPETIAEFFFSMVSNAERRN